MTDWLECPVCGVGALESDKDGLFWDGDGGPCPECGVVLSVSCDSETPAYVNTNEHAEDIGQPGCDNSCGEIYLGSDKLRAEFLGSPCRWNCPRTIAWRGLSLALEPTRDLSRVAVRTCPISGLESHR